MRKRLIICDRCKTEMRNAPWFSVKYESHDIDPKYHAEMKGGAVFDMCPSCEKAFEQFMKGGEGDGA